MNSHQATEHANNHRRKRKDETGMSKEDLETINRLKEGKFYNANKRTYVCYWPKGGGECSHKGSHADISEHLATHVNFHRYKCKVCAKKYVDFILLENHFKSCPNSRDQFEEVFDKNTAIDYYRAKNVFMHEADEKEIQELERSAVFSTTSKHRAPQTPSYEADLEESSGPRHSERRSSDNGHRTPRMEDREALFKSQRAAPQVHSLWNEPPPPPPPKNYPSTAVPPHTASTSTFQYFGQPVFPVPPSTHPPGFPARGWQAQNVVPPATTSYFTNVPPQNMFPSHVPPNNMHHPMAPSSSSSNIPSIPIPPINPLPPRVPATGYIPVQTQPTTSGQAASQSTRARDVPKTSQSSAGSQRSKTPQLEEQSRGRVTLRPEKPTDVVRRGRSNVRYSTSDRHKSPIRNPDENDLRDVSQKHEHFNVQSRSTARAPNMRSSRGAMLINTLPSQETMEADRERNLRESAASRAQRKAAFLAKNASISSAAPSTVPVDARGNPITKPSNNPPRSRSRSPRRESSHSRRDQSASRHRHRVSSNSTSSTQFSNHQDHRNSGSHSGSSKYFKNGRLNW